MITNESLQAAANAAPAPVNKVTAKYMLSRIKEVTSTVWHGTTTTIVNIELDNGYSVQGTHLCVDPAEFDERDGRNLAYDAAFRKLWPLFGFLLAEERFRPERDFEEGFKRAKAHPKGGQTNGPERKEGAE